MNTESTLMPKLVMPTARLESVGDDWVAGAARELT